MKLIEYERRQNFLMKALGLEQERYWYEDRNGKIISTKWKFINEN